ncbi:hypothetical protein B0J12DRAFT_767433 [Macrophomina phaseolina]|uniref:Uroporphyrinogen decarboxylase (URO-D) domain-containing protein n=1 Tax=Macrophomina phaseolina TaxID=35725 RepID=A0ABQ8FY54_9PEZI|nr:hypothetical protein B0J12DRAFT_767433 [Macrophomina phaseolina]
MTSPTTTGTTRTKPRGVHLVGSICGAPTATAAFTTAATALPSRLRRLPDGEPAHRSTFIGWQMGVFAAHTPALLRTYDSSYNPLPQPVLRADQARALVASMPRLEPGYDAAAIESYAAFRELKAQGVVPERARFQVCLPTAFCVMCLLRPGCQALVEPLYEQALVGCLRRIEAAVPAHELAVQWDVAAEPMTLEGAYWPHFEPYFEGDVFEGLVGRIARLAGSVAEGVEVGLHVCYGDMGHKHFVEPKDMGLMARVVRGVVEGAGRKVDWVHLPVPRARDDGAYFEPLKSLELGDTELYLGLVHAHDKEGTERRLKVAQDVLGERMFGVATECGLGRTPTEDFTSIAEISCEVSAPIY